MFTLEKDTEALSPERMSDTNIKVKVFPEGLVSYGRLITIKLRCPMNFQVRILTLCPRDQPTKSESHRILSVKINFPINVTLPW